MIFIASRLSHGRQMSWVLLRPVACALVSVGTVVNGEKAIGGNVLSVEGMRPVFIEGVSSVVPCIVLRFVSDFIRYWAQLVIDRFSELQWSFVYVAVRSEWKRIFFAELYLIDLEYLDTV